MNWMATLHETYEQAAKKTLRSAKLLMPINHTLQNAHIKISIDGKGNFLDAEVLEKTQVILPATEQSASRSSGEAPHPLADKLQYVAKDYPTYGGKKKPYFNSYYQLLSQWCQSPHKHQKAQAVLRYIEKGTVVHDLVNYHVLHVDEQLNLLAQYSNSDESTETPALLKVLPKEKGQFDQGSALVCWSVAIPGDPVDSTWTDKTLQDSWIAFINSNPTEQSLCYITGQPQPLAATHPAKIRHSGDKAKLISSNDTSGFTFRGRFENSDQALGIGLATTQKAHNALSWLIQRQGYRNGDQVYVTWAISEPNIPDPLKIDADSLIHGYEDSSSSDTSGADEQDDSSIDIGANLGRDYARKVRLALAGYQLKFENLPEKIIVMGVDSPTPGRMGIVLYREFIPQEFFGNIEAWYLDSAWPQRVVKKTEDKKSKPIVLWPISSPVPYAIAEAAYGKSLNDKLKQKTIERIVPCIIERRPIPYDLVLSSVQTVSNRAGYSKDDVWKWNRDLCVVCSLFRNHHSSRNTNPAERRNYTMSLDRNRNSRDYLYGRLLAIGEAIEQRVLRKADEKRLTRAETLMQRFSQRPFSTWKTIRESLVPYIKRLKSSASREDNEELNFYDDEIQQISDLFIHDDFVLDKPLTGEYLLGYYCQKNYRRENTSTDNSDQSILEEQ